jgi:CheY-like chemotaxis protein
MSPQVLLCIDDRPQMLQLRKTNLEPLGYSVITATDSSAAITILEQLAVAAVLVECKHEGIDAQAIAYQIKQRFPHEPIILLSAYSDMPETPLWLVDEYVMRSEPLERLAEVVERVTRPNSKVAPRSERLQKREATA